MKCVLCGGRIEFRKITFVYDNDKDYFLIENVPAEVCVQCGEKSYTPEVTDVLIRLAKKKLNPPGQSRCPFSIIPIKRLVELSFN
ncbi:MAG: type II toxin-antitoxin system MqsA family antitoxin [bacterium]